MSGFLTTISDAASTATHVGATEIAEAASAKADIEGQELFEKEERSSDTTKINNNTLLKQGISLTGALVSRVVTQPIFGVKIPVYEGTLGDKLINPLKEREALSTSSIDEAEETPKISVFHNITRNAANALITAVNIPLFIATRSAFPTFEATPPSFVTNLKAYAKSKALNVYAWHDQHKDQPTITGSIARGAEALAKGINYAHESWGSLLRSKAVYHTLNVGVGITTLGFMGPPGWAIAVGIVAADIIRGSARVNRIQVKQDELAHLSSLKQSQKQIENLEHGHSADFLKDLGKPELQSTTYIASPQKTKDDLNQAAYKAALPTLLKEGISVGVTAANAAVNHVGFAIATSLAFLSFSTNTKAKLSEQDAKDAIKDRTNHLYQETGAQHNPEQSRQYDLAKSAYEHAVYAKALEVAATKPGYTAQEYRHEAETVLKKDPEFQKLFSNDKLEKPSGLGTAYSWAKTATLSTLDYLHPFKEATTYEKAHADFVEKEVQIRHTTQHSPAAGITPTPPVHNQQAELAAKKERESLTSRSSSSEHYSEPIPLINRSRSQSRDSSRGL